MAFYSDPVSTSGLQAVRANSSQSASFTAAANTNYVVNASSGAVTVTLPTSTTYQSIVVQKSESSTNAVILSGTINGSATTISLTKLNQAKQLYADASGGWIVIGGDVDDTLLTSSATTTGFLSTIGAASLTVGTAAPSSPAAGDLWVDTN